MAYNRRNKLKQVKAVLEVYNREKKDGISTQYVFRTFIEPRFHISCATLYNYLAMPVNKLIKEEDAKLQKSKSDHENNC
jgi:hypothetical protein